MKCRYADKCGRDLAYYCTDDTMMKCMEGLQFLVAEQASDNAALQERCNELEKKKSELQHLCDELILKCDRLLKQVDDDFPEKVGSI